MNAPAAGGTYALVLYLPAPETLQIGRLGRFVFPAGCYVYVGSALNGLQARLARHRRLEKRLYWHVDYLRQHARIVEVYAAEGGTRAECQLANAVGRLEGAVVPVAGFGASDCRCRAHLFWFPRGPVLDSLVDGLGPT